MLEKAIEWGSKKVYIPRLWTQQEWNKLSPKEKMWLWYKHHDTLMSTGNGELDKLLPFLKGEFLTTAGIFTVISIQLGLPTWMYFLYPILYVAYKLFQWFIGDMIDKQDLIALSSEISNKRQIAFRVLRKAAEKEEWRKGKG